MKHIFSFSFQPRWLKPTAMSRISNFIAVPFMEREEPTAMSRISNFIAVPFMEREMERLIEREKKIHEIIYKKK